jgi:hypothetical protein
MKRIMSLNLMFGRLLSTLFDERSQVGQTPRLGPSTMVLHVTSIML